MPPVRPFLYIGPLSSLCQLLLYKTIFQTPSGYVQQVPQVSIAQQNLKIMQSFCSEFGLTPATRARIIAAGGGSDDTFSEDPMERLLKGGWNGDV